MQISRCGVYAFMLFFTAMSLWGCARAPLIVEPIEPGQESGVLLGQLEQQFERARAEQVDLLSPVWFHKAWRSYTAAKGRVEENPAEEARLEQLAVVRAQLQQAEVVAVRSRDQLAEVIERRVAALAVDADQFASDFAAAENSLLDLTRAIENDQFAFARRLRDKVADQYRQLELRAIEQSALGETNRIVRQSRQERVHQIAPKSFEEAESALKEAQDYFGRHPEDQDGIAQRSERAFFLARRSLAIADAARLLAQMTPEDMALWVETFLFQITTRMQSPDRRDLPFDQQQGAIMAALDALRSDLALARKSEADQSVLIEAMSDRLAEVEGRAQAFRHEQRRLAAENRLNDQLFQVQALFEPHEAVVIRQSDQVVIRLTGLRFAAGSAALHAAGYGTLHKVQQAIRIFGNPEVVVQGHTDSTGRPESNLALSRERAETVRQVLAQDATFPAPNILAVGLAADHPIAPNDSAQGRALNRRIDIVIQTGEMKRR